MTADLRDCAFSPADFGQPARYAYGSAEGQAVELPGVLKKGAGQDAERGGVAGNLADFWIPAVDLVDGDGRALVPEAGRILTLDPDGAAEEWKLLPNPVRAGQVWRVQASRHGRPGTAATGSSR